MVESKAQVEATRHWEPLLIRWQRWLQDDGRRAEAEARLAEVEDPLAVVALAHILCASADNQARVLRVLGRIDHPQSTRLLVRLAVYSDFDAVRRAAAAALSERPES